MVPKTDSRVNNIGVLGGGSWGTALAVLLARNGHNVVLWEFQKEIAKQAQKNRENKTFLPGITLPDTITVTSNLEETVNTAAYILFVVPSHVFRSVAQQVSQCGVSGKKLISATKGIENHSLMRMSEILMEEIPAIPENNVSVLSGPSFASEVAHEIPTAVVVASKNESFAMEVQDLFMCSTFRVYTNTDVAGVELGGAFKNVLAIATGIADGVGFGDNSKAALLTRGIVEITRLGVALGAQEKTFSGLSGMGDLILTCMGKLSRNLHVGTELGKGKSLQDILDNMVNVAEGVKTAESVWELSRREGIETPIMEKVYQILFHALNPRTAVLELMTRDAKSEHSH